MTKAIFKFNGGIGALLCSKCYKILLTGPQFTNLHWMAMRGEIDLPPVFCDTCGEENTPLQRIKYITSADFKHKT